MADKVSDFLIKRLREWGVRRIFGYAGDGINGIMGALNRADNEPEFIQARHEEMAAFMACGHAKFTGEVGVCLATSGPGAIHLLNGLYDAKMDHKPVVAIVGQTARTAMGSHYQQEVDLEVLLKDVASEYLVTVNTPEQLPMAVDRAMRIAMSQRSVTAIIVPSDVQEMKAVETPPHQFKVSPGSKGFAMPRVVANLEEIHRAADILNSGKKVAILIGQGARRAADEVMEIADKLGAGVAKALLGKDVLPDDLPYVTGSIGLLGTKPSFDMMMECDTLLMIGSSFPYSQFLPQWEQAKGVQIDLDARMIGLRFPMDVNLVGDAKETLKALLPLVKTKHDSSWRKQIEDSVRRWWRIVEARAMQDAHPVNPQRIFWEMSPLIPDHTIIAADSGSSTNWYARDVKIRKGMRSSLSGTLATMGCGVPYAIGAKFAHPDRCVVACVGDGAFQMNGMAEMLTVAKYWHKWQDPRLVVVVLHNNDLNQVTWEQRVMAGDPKFEASQDLPDYNYAAYAQSLGLEGIRVERPEQVKEAWQRAFSAQRPVVIDAVVDANVPPLPPHITWDQAKKISAALLAGDPDAADIIRHSFKGKLEEFIK